MFNGTESEPGADQLLLPGLEVWVEGRLNMRAEMSSLPGVNAATNAGASGRSQKEGGERAYRGGDWMIKGTRTWKSVRSSPKGDLGRCEQCYPRANRRGRISDCWVCESRVLRGVGRTGHSQGAILMACSKIIRFTL